MKDIFNAHVQHYNRSCSWLRAVDSCEKKLANIFLERNASKIIINSTWPWCSVKFMLSDAENQHTCSCIFNQFRLTLFYLYVYYLSIFIRKVSFKVRLRRWTFSTYFESSVSLFLLNAGTLTEFKNVFEEHTKKDWRSKRKVLNNTHLNTAYCNSRLEEFCYLNSKHHGHNPKQTGNENSVYAPRTFPRSSQHEAMTTMHLKIHLFPDGDLGQFYKEVIRLHGF